VVDKLIEWAVSSPLIVILLALVLAVVGRVLVHSPSVRSDARKKRAAAA